MVLRSKYFASLTEERIQSYDFCTTLSSISLRAQKSPSIQRHDMKQKSVATQ